MNFQRVRGLTAYDFSSDISLDSCVVYWMSRDQRLHDNWALLYAQGLALRFCVPLRIVFVVVPSFAGATLRHYDFMLRNLAILAEDALRFGIAFDFLSGDPLLVLPCYIAEFRACALVTDFSPLRVGRLWREGVALRISIPFYEVDAHNIVPAWIASCKQAFAASTFRPQLYALLPSFLDTFPSLLVHPYPSETQYFFHFDDLLGYVRPDSSIGVVRGIESGEVAAWKQFSFFLDSCLFRYALERNIPYAHAQSGLSVYLHFGHISAQRIVLTLRDLLYARGLDIFSFLQPHRNDASTFFDVAVFLEELIVRRELADNFCLYNFFYDSFLGFPAWARTTLDAHRADRRAYLYSRDDFEFAQTHDDAWNASQLEMVKTGKMHGYMRMYWAKKILEWTESPEEALAVAIYLNDRYELDGRDPNGYTGIAWSIGGVHDRPWFERPIFGKVRYMSYSGLAKKFDIQRYILYVSSL